jgi:O-antigen ligase
MAAYGLALLLVLVTLGEGGGHALSMMGWHTLLVLLVLFVLLFAGPSRTTLPRSVMIPGALFLLLFVFGALRAPYAYAALLVSIELACCLAVIWIASRHAGWLLQRLATPLQLAAVAQALLVGLQWSSGGALRPAGTFLNPNHLSLWMVAVTLFALGSLRPGDSRTRRLSRLALALPAATAVVLAGSRGALLALGAGSIWLLWVRRARIPRRAKVALVVALALVVAGIGLRQLSRLDRYDPFRYHRIHIWQASAAIVAERPLWGSGPGQLADVAANHRFADGDGPLRYDKAFANTHSDWLRLPAEFGLPAALAAWTGIALAVATVVRRRRRGQLEPGADGPLAALVAIGTQALVDNPSSWPSVYLLGATMVGIVLSRRRDGRASRGAAVRGGLAATLCLVFSLVDVAPFLAWRSVDGLPRGALDGAGLARLERAIARNPLHPGYRLRLAEHHAGDPASWGVGRYGAAREAAETAARLHPGSARYRRGVASVESRSCRTLFPDVACRERTAALFEQAESLARFDPFLPIARAAFLIDMRDPASARRAAERAMTLEPEAVLPQLLMVDVLASSGRAADRERAAELLRQARERAAGFAGWNEGPDGVRLLRPDPAIFDRLQAKLERPTGD